MNLEFHTITNGDKDRINSTKKAFKRYGLSTTFFHFKKHPTNGKLGCFLSHIKMFKYAYKHNMEYICISEDNLTTISTRLKSIYKNIETFITTHPNWNMLLIGGWYIPLATVEPTIYHSIYKTNSIHGTSCYIIHKRFYTKILKQYTSHIDEHIDAYLMRKAQPCAYILSPLLFRRNNIIPTSNTYFSNEIVNGYYYMICSKSAHNMMEYYATNHIVFWSIAIIIILLCIILWFLYKKQYL
jgi:GR25 family glycosyltransferase involved in LPS biosynthesis